MLDQGHTWKITVSNYSELNGSVKVLRLLLYSRSLLPSFQLFRTQRLGKAYLSTIAGVLIYFSRFQLFRTQRLGKEFFQYSLFFHHQ